MSSDMGEDVGICSPRESDEDGYLNVSPAPAFENNASNLFWAAFEQSSSSS